NASLMAQAHGVSQIYMGLIQTACKLIRAKRVTRLFQLPPRHKPYALMAIGMPAFRYPRYTERD
ncbi:MAG: nitroreductase, partial [Prevotella sp.]|nr:nitroreductase [Prevotella sp.]